MTETEKRSKLPAFLTDAGEKGSITGSTLKIIAIITMLADHIGAVVLEGYLRSVNFDFSVGVRVLSEQQLTPFIGIIYVADMILRLIGRLSFPIFCFLLSEGYMHTHSRLRYALRLLAFSFLSEVPFDLALGYENGVVGIIYQNVFFTLFIGLLTIWGIEHFQRIIPLPVFIFFAGILGAEFLRTDYGGFGVLTILVIHFLRKKSNALAMLAGCLVQTLCNIVEFTCLFDFLLVRKYNGQRGLKLKYVFYLFYPVHLFILYLIKCAVIS